MKYDAKYKSPSGQVVYFQYEDLESLVEKKAGVYESALHNGTYVKPRGRTGGRFPMLIFISGTNYEQKAEAFLSAVLEDGVGVLTHPIHSDINVVPVGEVRRIDPLVTEGNQVKYTLTFFETTKLQIGDVNDIDTVFDNLLQASAVDFSNGLEFENDFDKESFMSNFNIWLNQIEKKMKVAGESVASVQYGIEDTGDSIRRGFDVLIGDPLSLAFQVQILIGEPRRQRASTRAKLAAYNNLANSIFERTIQQPSKYTREPQNDFLALKMMGQAIVGHAAMLAAEASDFETSSDYLNSMSALELMLENYRAWHDESFTTLATTEIDPASMDIGAGFENLIGVLSRSMAMLLKKSTTAKTPYRFTLTEPRNPIELCFELYGTAVGEALDQFWAQNAIQGDEFFLIPEGREIVAYL